MKEKQENTPGALYGEREGLVHFSAREPKRVCAIHDLSAWGRCALTVVVPTLSALGIQTVPLPTALMSTHTGGFDDIYIRDLTEDMTGMYKHWLSLGITFSSIYSGFVLNASQAHVISEVIDRFRTEDTLVLVDPVMGDDGVLYSTCTQDVIEVMRSLCKKADLITPNLTEACLLTDTPYPEPFGSKQEAHAFASMLIEELKELAPKIAVTGIEYTDDGVQYVTVASAERGCAASFIAQKKEGASYPGTGELFASVLLGVMLDGFDFLKACGYAAEFVADTIRLSEESVVEYRRGTALEPALMRLAHDMYEYRAKQNI